MAHTLKTAFRYVLGIDFETASSSRASACSVGLYLKEFNTPNVLFEKEILIDPECDFGYHNMRVHGIRPNNVKGCNAFPCVVPIIADLITPDTLVVAHNASFDISVLRRSCERYRLDTPEFDYMCTYMMAKYIMPDLPCHRLDFVSEYFKLPSFEHHNALDDARACVFVFEKLMAEISCIATAQVTRRCGIVCGHVCCDGQYTACHKSSTSKTVLSVDATALEGLQQPPKAKVKHAPVIPLDDTLTESPSHPLYEKVVVFTGELSSFSREVAQSRLKQIGGVPALNITKKTNFLVCGMQMQGRVKSSKERKAEKYISEGANMKILTEEEYLLLFDATC